MTANGARAGLVSYAEALASMHAWSMRRPGELAGRRARYAPTAPPGPSWLGTVGRGREAFLGAAAAFGLAADGVGAEIDELPSILNGTGYTGLVHGLTGPGSGARPAGPGAAAGARAGAPPAGRGR